MPTQVRGALQSLLAVASGRLGGLGSPRQRPRRSPGRSAIRLLGAVALALLLGAAAANAASASTSEEGQAPQQRACERAQARSEQHYRDLIGRLEVHIGRKEKRAARKAARIVEFEAAVQRQIARNQEVNLRQKQGRRRVREAAIATTKDRLSSNEALLSGEPAVGPKQRVLIEAHDELLRARLSRLEEELASDGPAFVPLANEGMKHRIQVFEDKLSELRSQKIPSLQARKQGFEAKLAAVQAKSCLASSS